MNILIVKLSAIGDVVHTLPSLKALRDLYPEAHITWVIEQAALDIIKDNPYLDRIIISRRKQWVANLKKLKDIRRTLREITVFTKELRDRQYDLVIDFMGLLKSSLIVFLSGGRRKLGYKSMQELSGLFLNEKIYEDMGKHAVDRYLDFLRYLGADIGDPEFLIPIATENNNRIKELLKLHKVDIEDEFLVVSPMSFAGQTRLWEENKFATLCNRIFTELQVKIIFTGRDRKGIVERIQSLMVVPSINLSGQTSLIDLVYLYSLALLVISPDSGPMHIAAAVGTPVVALFGPSDPSRTGPYGQGHTVIRKGLPCSPCFKRQCSTIDCMKQISVEQVMDAVNSILS